VVGVSDLLATAGPVRPRTASSSGRPWPSGRWRRADPAPSARPYGVPVALDPLNLPETALEFLVERHLATMTTLRPDGSPHVVPVGFTFEAATGLVRVITSGTSRKVANVRRGSRVVVAQVDGRRWLALEGDGRVLDGPDEVADAEERYGRRYRTPRENPARVVVAFTADRVLGSVPPWD